MAVHNPAPSNVPVGTFTTSIPRLSNVKSSATSAPASSPSSGIPSFRSIRSLLPFGASKHASHPSAPPLATKQTSPPKTTSFGFGVARKSSGRERKHSFTSSRPVISIHRRASDGNTSADTHSQRSSLPHPVEHVESTRVDSVAPVLEPLVPGSPIELSTIIEADTSGVSVSKYLPPPSEPSSPLPAKTTCEEADVSALDLSTSQLSAQVLDAIKENPAHGKTWLNRHDPVVVDIPADSDAAAVDGDISFALEPSSKILSTPPSLVCDSSGPAHSQPSSTLPSLAIVAPSPMRATSSPLQSSTGASTAFTPPQSPFDSHPLLSPSAFARGPLKHSSHSQIRDDMNAQTPPPPSADSDMVSTDSFSPATSTVLYYEKHRPPSPLRESHLTPGNRPSTSPLSVGSSRRTRRPGLNRLFSSASSSSLNTSHTPADQHLSTLAREYTASRPSLSRLSPGSGVGETLPTMHTKRRSMSIDQHNLGRASLSRSRPSTRMSASTSSARDPDTKPFSPGDRVSSFTPGPRTLKAFQRAGLLREDGDTEGLRASISRSPSVTGKYSSPRGSSDYAFSRSASRLSVDGTAFGVNRRCASGSTYTTATAASHVMESPTFAMTPRSVSTAATSVSGASSWDRSERGGSERFSRRNRDTDELQQAREKHADEMAAVLAALSDSQSMTRMLRSENAELRDRLASMESEVETLSAQVENLHQLEAENAKLREEYADLTMILSNKSAPRPSPMQRRRTSGSHGSGSRSPENLAIIRGRPSNSGLLEPTQIHRLSATSSIFPIVPANMSLLLHEENLLSGDYSASTSVVGHSSVAGSAGSPVGRASRQPSPMAASPAASPTVRCMHREANKSISSMTSFASSGADSSSVGLVLKPEHALHLDDMSSLDFSGIRSDDGDDDLCRVFSPAHS
ncbi:hypothetical protein FISHEDRAFT_77427 [Fistulina hepatica ATCC 64428]|uniref:Uncharacterized protein n=1 Tax=Fistulina hepatica ATCC 64428 TaxID=1128425 RepID=A0A0D7A1A2_9AGAR|nr:hypothetical protein FISHEDRAFT_77427 [Fistulina hepatica ATCC 64428]